MSDHQTKNKFESTARHRLVELARAMLYGDLPFSEGAVQVIALRDQIGGIFDRDPDFDAFMLIVSETDHLPLKEQHSLWDVDALKLLEPEFMRTEEWSSLFAPQACKRLIERFK